MLLCWQTKEVSIGTFCAMISPLSTELIDTDPEGQRPDIESLSKKPFKTSWCSDLPTKSLSHFGTINILRMSKSPSPNKSVSRVVVTSLTRRA